MDEWKTSELEQNLNNLEENSEAQARFQFSI